MAKTNLPVPQWFDQQWPRTPAEWEQTIRKNWKKALFIAIAIYLLGQKTITIDFSFGTPSTSQEANYQGEAASTAAQAMNVSMFQSASATTAPAKPQRRQLTPEEEAKRRKQLAYVKRYAKIAQEEMEKFGIPASITLAQGILESNIGASKLATRNNNHFGIKCFSRSCKKGHCSNFTDDSHKDFFRIYQSAWESYRAHSNLLQGKRYKHLRELGTKNYRDWAHGLKKAGYATDKRYAEKLIRYIEDLELYNYDS